MLSESELEESSSSNSESETDTKEPYIHQDYWPKRNRKAPKPSKTLRPEKIVFNDIIVNQNRLESIPCTSKSLKDDIYNDRLMLSRSGIYSDPDNCQCFYNCANGVPYHTCCAEDTLWDEVSRKIPACFCKFL